jgi:hypothetical protein
LEYKSNVYNSFPFSLFKGREFVWRFEFWRYFFLVFRFKDTPKIIIENFG